MLQKLSTLFQNLLSENGNLSMVRFLSLVCVTSAVLIAVIGLLQDKHSLEAVALLCGTFLGAGLGAKVWQKGIEASEVSSSHSETLETNVVESGENVYKK